MQQGTQHVEVPHREECPVPRAESTVSSGSKNEPSGCQHQVSEIPSAGECAEDIDTVMEGFIRDVDVEIQSKLF